MKGFGWPCFGREATNLLGIFGRSGDLRAGRFGPVDEHSTGLYRIVGVCLTSGCFLAVAVR